MGFKIYIYLCKQEQFSSKPSLNGVSGFVEAGTMVAVIGKFPYY